MTQTAQQEPTPDAADAAPATVQYEAWQVRIITGTYPLQFTKGKLWPQADKQLEYARISYQYSCLISQLAENEHLAKTAEYAKFATEARELKKKLDSMAADFKFTDAPIEALVREIHEVNGNVYIIGVAFGSMSYAPIEDIPKAACIVSRRITEEAFQGFILTLRELAAIEASLVDVDDGVEEEEEDDDAVVEEDDDNEPAEPSTGDIVVEAAVALVSSATSIEARPEGPVVLVPANVWEPLCQAIAAHLSEGSDEAHDPVDDPVLEGAPVAGELGAGELGAGAFLGVPT